MSADTPAATAFSPAEDGTHAATVVIRAPVNRMSPNGQFRGVAIHAEIWCDLRIWRIVNSTYYAADYAVLHESGPIPEAPLVRETPLHSAITDVCDGGHTGPVGLVSEDVVEVQRWLDNQ